VGEIVESAVVPVLLAVDKNTDVDTCNIREVTQQVEIPNARNLEAEEEDILVEFHVKEAYSVNSRLNCKGDTLWMVVRVEPRMSWVVDDQVVSKNSLGGSTLVEEGMDSGGLEEDP